MRILLDTHIFIWWDNDPHQLPAHAIVLCEDPVDRLLIAQANAEGIGLLSVDAVFKQYDVKLLA